MPFVELADLRLHCRRIDAAAADAPPLVFLHEGLGSVETWRDFPDRVAAATGCAALIYSRRGYGRSTPLAAPRRVDFMHDEALVVLPALLRALDVAAPVLIGHSDGASIALIHAASPGADLRGLVLMAPHVFVEDVTVAGIEAAREAWRTSDLRRRLAPHHDDVDGAFRGWNDIWLAPEFRAWDIAGELPRVVAPALLIQGEDDQYGTPAQLAAIAAGVAGPTETLLLPGCRHSPHRDRPEETLAAIARFVAALR